MKDARLDCNLMRKIFNMSWTEEDQDKVKLLLNARKAILQEFCPEYLRDELREHQFQLWCLMKTQNHTHMIT